MPPAKNPWNDLEGFAIKGPYTRHREAYAECDFCGGLTRGRIYESDSAVVRCGACHRIMQTLETPP